MRRLVALILLGASLVIAAPAFTPTALAQEEPLILDCENLVLNPDGTVNEEATTRCSVDDFVRQFVRLAQWGLTIVVFLAVLMFVYGGFEFITAGGRQAKISSGQNIISGTIIGLVISMSAYVIINFAVGAITGTQTSTNPFTAISTVFGNRQVDGVNINKPFSGDGDAATENSCRSIWDTTCVNQVLCADPADDGLNGTIASVQSQLKTLGCGCEIDGCYGKGTAQCVRRFQVANNLVPTGTIDEATTDALLLATPQSCTGAAARVTTVMNNLPATTHDTTVKNANPSTTGCCVVQKDISGTATPLYCINSITERGCAALGAGYIFASGKACSQDAKTIPLCGYCTNPAERCFQQVGKYWCEQAIKNITGTAMTFKPGICAGGTEFCNANGPSCTNAVAP